MQAFGPKRPPSKQPKFQAFKHLDVLLLLVPASLHLSISSPTINILSNFVILIQFPIVNTWSYIQISHVLVESDLLLDPPYTYKDVCGC